MIRTLKIRLMALVVTGLLLASAVLVVAINGMNLRSVSAQAETVLAMLEENGGKRPDFRGEADGTAPERPQGTLGPEGTFSPDRRFGRRGDLANREIRNAVNFSNYFLVYLQEDGTVERWESERQGLYSDEQILSFASSAGSDTSGRIGDVFFRRSNQLLIAVDATIEMQNARSFLHTTVLVALVQWAVLSAGAVWLIHRMVKPVDEAMEKQKQFVWDASHELKTPLAVISANAEVLSGEVGDHPSLQYIQSEVQRTDKLVQNLLTLARMEKGTVKAAHEKFDLSRALLGVALPFESTVFEAGKQFDTRIPDGIFYTGDEAMVKQLLMILLSNAVKYSDPGGQITLTLEARGDKRLIRVHNTGPAIPQEAQEKIFDRFYRVDSSHNRETPGNGLGLAIARSLAEAMKGKITVQSEEGKGTAFTVTL